MAYIGRLIEVRNRLDLIIKARAFDQSAGYGRENIVTRYSSVTKLYCYLAGVEPDLTNLLEMFYKP